MRVSRDFALKTKIIVITALVLKTTRTTDFFIAKNIKTKETISKKKFYH
jgi:hypothetical protein